MCAEDTGHMFIPEEGIRYGDRRILETLIYRDDYPKVIQCPFILPHIHRYTDCFVVFVRRPRKEIEASMSKMQDKDGKVIALHTWLARDARHYHTDGDIMEAKLETWELQKERLPKHMEIQYHDLEDHWMWIPSDGPRDHHFRAAADGMV
jgi:hypothetical protein